MAPKHIELCLVLVLVTMLFHGAVSQSGCTTVLVGLAPCLNYITGNSSTPSSSCCSQLARVVQSQPRCLCSVLNSSGSSLGIAINQSQALALPGACNVQTPPASQCNTADSPASSPVSPPADSSDETPETPTSPPMPSIPSGSGSKTVPTADGSSSSGSIITMPLHFTVFILFLASCFSSAIKNGAFLLTFF